MSYTTDNYEFTVPEIDDIPDISVLSQNWDNLDEILNGIDTRNKIETASSTVDLNGYTEQGIYRFTSSHTPTNVPSGCTEGWLFVVPWNNAYEAVQFWLNYADRKVYIRKRVYPTWGEWNGLTTSAELSDIYNQLHGAIESNTALIVALQAAIGSPLVASSAESMTDQTKVYVYTGTTTSTLTNGHWYYYDNGWTDGGVYNSFALETDKTLSIPDMAADAETVGDELTDLKSDLNYTNSLIYDEIETTFDSTDTSLSVRDDYKLSFSEGEKLYCGTHNVAQLLNIAQGSVTINDVTITASGNTITISGQPSSSFNYSVEAGAKKTTTELAAMTLPLPIHIFTLSQKVTSGTVFPSLAVRSKSSGNAVTCQNNTSVFTMDTASHGGLYLYLESSKSYSCTFVIALIPYSATNGNTHRKETSSVTEYTTDGIYTLSGFPWVIGSPTIYELATKMPKKPACVYSTRSIEYSSMRECLDIYIPAKVGYVNYVFGRTQTDATQAEGGGNVWRLVRIDAVGDGLGLRYKITQLGETEMAIQIMGRGDFIGGTTHGDEWMDVSSLLFTLDGVPVDVTTLTTVTNFDTLKCYLVSNMYDPDDHTTIVGVHAREWIFDETGLYIGQTVEFKEDLTLYGSYLPMVCAIRGNDAVSEEQITDIYVDDGNYQKYDVSTGGFTNYPNELKEGIGRVNLFGTESGINITVDFIEQPENMTRSGTLLYNGVDTYNKLYHCICGHGNTEAYSQAVQNGDKWSVKSKISVDIGI